MLRRPLWETTSQPRTQRIFIAETATTSVPSPWSASRISCSRNGWQGCRGVTTPVLSPADFGNPPIPVAAATTEVNIPLADIVAGKHAIDVESPNADNPEDSVACANIGGVVDEHGDLFVGLSESKDPGIMGSSGSMTMGPARRSSSSWRIRKRRRASKRRLAALAAAEEEAAATPAATPGATPIADANATPVT